MITYDVTDFGASTSNADNHQQIQAAIDAAVKTSGRVFIPQGRYKISAPLVAYNWQGTKYGQVTIDVIGESNMWDNQNRTVIVPTFKDKFAFGIQQGKGCLVKGLTFQGLFNAPRMSVRDFMNCPLSNYDDITCRNSRYSPYSGVVVDPFCGILPSDGGWPGMEHFYRGPMSRSGSTGLRFEDISIQSFTVQVIISPNGYTQNADILTFENIRFYNGRIGFAGCQAQEKMNRIINLGAWGTMHTLIAFNAYGAGQPGNWFLDGINVAGAMNQLVHRTGASWGPMFMTKVYSESLGRIGFWQTGTADALTSSFINLEYAEDIGNYPDCVVEYGGVTLRDVTLRYYGRRGQPIVCAGKGIQVSDFQNVRTDGNQLIVWENYQAKVMNMLKLKQYGISPDPLTRTLVLKGTDVKIGDIVLFYDNYYYIGVGTVDSVSTVDGTFVVGKLSPAVMAGKAKGAGIFVSQVS